MAFSFSIELNSYFEICSVPQILKSILTDEFKINKYLYIVVKNFHTFPIYFQTIYVWGTLQISKLEFVYAFNSLFFSKIKHVHCILKKKGCFGVAANIPPWSLIHGVEW